MSILVSSLTIAGTRLKRPRQFMLTLVTIKGLDFFIHLPSGASRRHMYRTNWNFTAVLQMNSSSKRTQISHNCTSHMNEQVLPRTSPTPIDSANPSLPTEYKKFYPCVTFLTVPSSPVWIFKLVYPQVSKHSTQISCQEIVTKLTDPVCGPLSSYPLLSRSDAPWANLSWRKSGPDFALASTVSTMMS